MRYEFPWPPRELSPNVSVHWRTLARAKAQYKYDCFWTAMEHMDRHSHIQSLLDTRRFPLKPPVTAQVTFVCDARRRDPDNHMAMLKPLWDALVDMGVLEDDNKDALHIEKPRWERGPEKKVIVELSPYRDGPTASPEEIEKARRFQAEQKVLHELDHARFGGDGV